LGHGKGEAFTSKRFRNWKTRSAFDAHIGLVNSVHNQCVKKCEDVIVQKQAIETVADKQSNEAKSEYRVHLYALVEVAR